MVPLPHHDRAPTTTTPAATPPPPQPLLTVWLQAVEPPGVGLGHQAVVGCRAVVGGGAGGAQPQDQRGAAGGGAGAGLEALIACGAVQAAVALPPAGRCLLQLVLPSCGQTRAVRLLVREGLSLLLLLLLCLLQWGCQDRLKTPACPLSPFQLWHSRYTPLKRLPLLHLRLRLLLLPLLRLAAVLLRSRSMWRCRRGPIVLLLLLPPLRRLLPPPPAADSARRLPQGCLPFHRPPGAAGLERMEEAVVIQLLEDEAQGIRREGGGAGRGGALQLSTATFTPTGLHLPRLALALADWHSGTGSGGLLLITLLLTVSSRCEATPQ